MKKIALLIALSFSLAAQAEVKVDQPWVRGTIAAQKSTGAFMTLTSDKPVSLVSAASPAAKIVEIHEMKIENNVMKMKAMPKLDIVPGKPTELKPGSYHVMLIELVKPLSKGDSVPLTLEFKDADGKSSKQEVKAEVRDLTSGPAAHK
ncbi:MAG: copper chaperone PCu(A)C [Betaproteobacteria bacterium]|nr:copper chaperone PCu(A)C [Betaproteobacteria bacterium]